MAEPAAPSKSDARRSEILDRLADHLLAEGLEAASLRPLANASGTSDRMLLYYFEDKAALIAAALTRVAERMTNALTAGASAAPLAPAVLRERLIGLVLAGEMWPYMRLWLEIAARAARGEAPYRGIGEAIGRGFLAWGVAQLEGETLAAREAAAARLLVEIEGLALLKSLGMEAEALRGLGRD